jgi:hypothetical protein
VRLTSACWTSGYEVPKRTWRTVAAYHCLPPLYRRHPVVVEALGDGAQGVTTSALALDAAHDC